MIDKRILGKVVAKPILEQVSRQVAELRTKGVATMLGFFRDRRHAGSLIVRSQSGACS
jgi:hypothetical protein